MHGRCRLENGASLRRERESLRIHTIAVAIDGSTFGELALEFAIDLVDEEMLGSIRVPSSATP